MARWLLSIWFPRLASDISLRDRPVEGPFAVTLRVSNAEHLPCLNTVATAAGLHRGMPLADARAVCPTLSTRPADLIHEGRALEGLRRWASRYGPHAAKDGTDGLIVDVSGVPHLCKRWLSPLRSRVSACAFAVDPPRDCTWRY